MDRLSPPGSARGHQMPRRVPQPREAGLIEALAQGFSKLQVGGPRDQPCWRISRALLPQPNSRQITSHAQATRSKINHTKLKEMLFQDNTPSVKAMVTLDWFPDTGKQTLGSDITNGEMDGGDSDSGSYVERPRHLVHLWRPSLEPEKEQVINTQPMNQLCQMRLPSPLRKVYPTSAPAPLGTHYQSCIKGNIPSIWRHAVSMLTKQL